MDVNNQLLLSHFLLCYHTLLRRERLLNPSHSAIINIVPVGGVGASRSPRHRRRIDDFGHRMTEIIDGGEAIDFDAIANAMFAADFNAFWRSLTSIGGRTNICRPARRQTKKSSPRFMMDAAVLSIGIPARGWIMGSASWLRFIRASCLLKSRPSPDSPSIIWSILT
jgi:hypothetical protein